MPGTRNGPGNRAAWEHPQDLVNLLTELWRLIPEPDGSELPVSDREREERFHYQQRCIDIAWMHDLFEDGKKEDGSQVTEEDLYAEGFNQVIVTGVRNLTHEEEKEAKIAHLARLASVLSSAEATVKLADRICNLREGKMVFKDKRWARVIQETKAYIVPLLDKVGVGSERNWLETWLREAIEARPVVEGT